MAALAAERPALAAVKVAPAGGKSGCATVNAGGADGACTIRVMAVPHEPAAIGMSMAPGPILGCDAHLSQAVAAGMAAAASGGAATAATIDDMTGGGAYAQLLPETAGNRSGSSGGKRRRWHKLAAALGCAMPDAATAAELADIQRLFLESGYGSCGDAGGPGHGHGVIVHQAPPAAGTVTHGVERRHLARRAWVFVAAMSLHGLMDGLGVGVSSDASAVSVLAVAVLAHKAFDGLAVGAAIFPAAAISVRQRWLMLLASAATTPLGVGVGMAVLGATAGSTPAVSLANAIVLALSGGSFLYIAIVEMLPAALADGHAVSAKMAAFSAGFAIMAALGAIV